MPPGMNGVDTDKEIRTIDPGLNIVFVTGYSDTDPRDMAKIVPPVERLFYVAKPFQPLELQQFASALSNKWRAEQDLVVAHELLKEQYADLEAANAELAAAKHRAEAASRMKTEFLANVSHELRTPLNSILGFAELLKDLTSAGSEPKIARYIQNINTAGHNLLDLINDLLDLAKIEAGKMEVRSEPLSLADLFEALSSVLKPLTESKDLAIAPIVAPDVPIIETDPAKLQQILYNFLSNAIKFSPARGTIEVEARLEGPDRIRIGVTDHGPGIDPEKHNILFEKFRQLDGSVTREHSGTGLGLAISKELSVLLGGSIGVQSDPGQGATFYVILPLKIPATHADVRGRMALT
jgi:signal transduction histidine kinase